MSEWQDQKLGEVITLQRGFDITKKEQIDGQYQVISSSGFNSTHNEYKVKGPGVVIGRKGSLGTVHFTEQNYWPHDTTLWVKDFKGNYPLYIYYFLKTLRLEKYDVGASNPTLNRNHVHKLNVSIPCVKTQQKIASILSAFDDLIENNNRRIAILEEMARLIYREWFVHYRYPGHEKDRLVDSGTELGVVPEGWDVKELGELFKVKSGYAFKSKNLSDKGKYGIVKIKNVTDNGVDVDNVDFHEGPIPDRGEKFILCNGDILLTMTGYIGRVARMPKTEKTYYVNQRVGKLFSEDQSVLFHFIYELLRSEEYQSKMNNLAYGAAQPNISSKNLHGMEIPKPSSNVIEKFNQFVEPIYNEVDLLLQKNRKLKKTRDLLLPKLISNKITI